MAKSVIGVVGEDGYTFQSDDSEVGARMAEIFKPTGMGRLIQGWAVDYTTRFDTNAAFFTEYAFPGNQDWVDNYAQRQGNPGDDPNNAAILASGGIPSAYTYNRLLYDDRAKWIPNYDGTLSKLVVNVIENNRIAPTYFRVLKNGENTDLFVVVPKLATGAFVSTGTLAFTSGDELAGFADSARQDTNDPEYVSNDITITSFLMTQECDDAAVRVNYATGVVLTDVEGSLETWPAVGGTALPDAWGWQLEDGPRIRLRTGGSATNDRFFSVPFVCSPEGGNWYYACSAASTGTLATIAEQRRTSNMKVRAPGTYSALRILRDDAWTGETVQRVGGLYVNSALSITKTFDSDAAGYYTLAGTAAVVDGDLIHVEVDASSDTSSNDGGYEPWGDISIDFESDDEWFDIHSHGNLTGFGLTASDYSTDYDTLETKEFYAQVFGGGTDQTAWSFFDEDHHRTRAEVAIAEAMTFKRLRVQVGAFSGSNVTIGLMINGVAGNQSVTVNGTGWFEDAVNTDTVNDDCDYDTANICYYLDNGGGAASTDLRIDCFEITAKVITRTCGEPCVHECPDALTLQKLRRRTFRMLGEDPDAPIYWSDDEIDRHINDVYRQAAQETKAIHYVEGIELTSGDPEGSLSAQAGQILRATFEDRVLHNVTKWDQDRTIADWGHDEGYIDSYITSLQDPRRIMVYKTWDGTRYHSYGPFENGAYTYAAYADIDYVIGDRVTVTDANDITRAYVAIDESFEGDQAIVEPGVGSDWTEFWAPIGLMVWCVKIPPDLTECDEPELPPWSHLGLAFGAAARALRKIGEMRDDGMRVVYEQMSTDYLKALKGYIANRTPERVHGMGRTNPRMRRPKPWDTVIED